MKPLGIFKEQFGSNRCSFVDNPVTTQVAAWSAPAVHIRTYTSNHLW